MPSACADDAAELVALAPDVILASGGYGRGAVAPGDPHRADRVHADRRSGRRRLRRRAWRGRAATPPDSPQFEYGMSGKWLELLKEIAPRVTRAAVLRDPTIPQGIGQFAVIQAVAPSFGVELRPIDVRDAPEIERAVTAFARSANGGLIVTASGLATRSSRADHHAGGPAQPARGLFQPLLRHWRRPDLLRGRSDRPAPARGRLRRSHPQGREAGRPSGAGADQIRAGDQPQDREGARPRVPPTLLARADEVIE